jgi:hypothetical protein
MAAVALTTILVNLAVSVAVSVLLSYIFPNKAPHQQGARAGDLNVQVSTYGTALPIHYGTIRCAGNVIWGQRILEVSQEKGGGGKSGGGATVYSYFGRFAVAFGEGTAKGFKRIWADNKLIWDGQHNTGGAKLGPYTFYTGTEDQLPNAFMESFEGPGNVPGYRGVCYMVFEKLPVTQFGGRLPNMNFELGYEGETVSATDEISPSDGVTDNAYATSGLLWFDPYSDALLSVDATKDDLSSYAFARISTARRELIRVSEQTPSMGQVFGNRYGICISNNGNLYMQGYTPYTDPGDIACVPFTEVDQSTFAAKDTFGDLAQLTDPGPLTTLPADKYPVGSSMGVVQRITPQLSMKAGTNVGGISVPVFLPNPGPPLASADLFAISSPPTGDISLGSVTPWYQTQLRLFWVNNINGEMTGTTYLTTNKIIAKNKIAKNTNEFGEVIVDPLGGGMYVIAYENNGYKTSGADEGNLEAIAAINIFQINAICGTQQAKPTPIYGIAQVTLKFVVRIPLATSPVDGTSMKRDNTGGAVNHVTGWSFINPGVQTGLPGIGLGSSQLAISNSSSRALISLWINLGNKKQIGHLETTKNDFGWYGKHQWTTDDRFAISRSSTDSPDTLTIDYLKTSDLTIDSSQTISQDDLVDAASDFIPVLEDTQKDAVFTNGWAPFIARHPVHDRLALAYRDNEGIVRIALITGSVLEAGSILLSDIVTDICERSHLTADDVDVSDLGLTEVLGYTIAGGGVTGRDALEPLQQAFLFDGVESDFKLKFPLRGHDPVFAGATIDADSIGKLRTGTEPTIKYSRVQEVELPTSFTVSYLDKDRDYLEGSQASKRVSLPVSQTQYSGNGVSLQLKPLVTQGELMKQLTTRWLYSVWSERVSLESQLGWRYAVLDPTDIVNVIYRDDVIRLRLAAVNMGADMSMEFSGNEEDARTHESDLGNEGGTIDPGTLPDEFITRGNILNLPQLSGDDSAPDGYFRVFYTLSGYTSDWPGAALMQSRDAGTTYNPLGTSFDSAAWGRVVGTMPDPIDPYRWNRQTITLYVESGLDQFSSATESDVLAGANAIAIIRADGQPEIIQFQDVLSTSNNQVVLSRLLRGRKGTEDLAYDHTSSELFVLINTAVLKNFLMPIASLNAAFAHKAVTVGTITENALPFTVQLTAQDLRPYSVAHLKGTRTGSDIVLDWVRRTRFDPGWGIARGDELPIQEENEEYLVEFYKPAEATPFLIRGAILDTTTTTLTQAQYETATGDTFSGDMPPIDVKVFQISAVVGRGRATRTEV